MSSISIIMACHNRAYELPRVLKAYDRQTTTEPFELIAVDDASSDGTYKVLAAYRPERFRLRAEKLDTNSGPSVARNHALTLAQSPLVAFVGDDGLPEPDYVAQHLRLHREYPAVGQAILGQVVWPEDMPRNTLMAHIDGIGAEQFSFHYMREGHEYDFRHMYTSNVSLKRELLASVDRWFDPELRAFEDGELAYRLTPHGLKIIFSARPTMRHYHYQTIWSFSYRQYWCAKVLPVFYRKHPEARVLVGRMPTWLTRARQPLLAASRFTAGRKPGIRDARGWLEKAALVLASYYEWLPNPLLNRLYIDLLRYYWRKGIIDGTIRRPDEAAWLHDVHAGLVLAPLMLWFIEAAQAGHIPLPDGYDRSLLHKLKGVALR